MATEGGGKLKLKRSQSAPKPYERRKSLYRKVTDTVKDLLSPSWLTDIVTTVKKSPPKETNIIEEDEDEAEMLMNPPSVVNQINSYSGPPRIASQLESKLPAPQPKRTRVPVSSAIPSLKKPAFSSTSTHQSSNFSPSQIPTSRYAASTSRNNIARPPLHGTDDIPSSSHSSSYSVIQDTPKEVLQLNENALQQIKDNLSPSQNRPAVIEGRQLSSFPDRSTSISEVQSKRPRLWGNEISQQVRPFEPAVKDKPSFKASLFGSPVIDTSLLGNETLNESSFYPGRTTFGGSSAMRNRNRLNMTAPYQTALPIKKQMKPKLANSSFSAVTSSSARRILESLERMSSPLTDAKKIPMEVPSISDSLLSFTPSSYRRQSFQPSLLSRRSLEVPSRSGPPTSQIRTHSIASISRNRQNFTSTPIATRTSSSILQDKSKESLEEIDPKRDSDVSMGGVLKKGRPKRVVEETPSSWGGGGGKMKREKSHHYSSKRSQDEEVMEISSLKSDFTLPVSQLPQIQFTATPILQVDDKTAKSIRESNERHEMKFSFSSPIHQSKIPQNMQTPVERIQGFTFSSPLKADNTSKEVNASKTVGFSFMSTTPSTAPKPKVNTLLGNGGVGYDLKSSSVVFKPDNKTSVPPVTDVFSPPTLKTGSVMDILGGPSPSSAVKSSSTLKQGSVLDVLQKNSGAFPASSLKHGSVMDVLSKDSNKVFNKKTEFGKSSKTGESLANLFSKPAGSWTCDMCMIQNNPDKTKCAACETPKPSSKPKGRLITEEKESLSSLFAKPSEGWTCDVCMIQNNLDKTKCAACETPKPGFQISGKTTDSLSGLFKTVEGSWECVTCMIQNKPDVIKCMACETPKPGEKNTGDGLSSGLKISSSGKGTITDSGFKVDLSQTQPATSGFQFGSSDSAAPPVGGGFQFVNTTTSDTKTTATSGFSFGSKDTTSTDQKVETGFSFGSPKAADQKSGFNLKAMQTSSDKTGTGFSFTNTIVNNKGENVSFGNTDASSVKTSSGFSLGAQSDASNEGGKKKSEVGGFQFNLPSKTNTDITSTQLNGKSSMGGYTFGNSNNKIQEPNNNDLEKAKSDNKSGFAFGQASNVSTGGFMFASTPPTSNCIQGETSAKLPNNFTFGGSSATPNNTGGLGVFPSKTPVVNLTNSFNAGSAKRGVEEDNDEPKAKKPFTFGGLSTTNGPFQFGVGAESKPSAVVQPERKTAPLFNFNASSNTNPTSNAGFSFTPNASAVSTKPADKPADSVFTFGGGSNTSMSTFGNTSNNFSSGAPAAFGSSSFGGNGSTSGSSIGSTQPAVAPAFGASSATPAFGASGQTPSFGNSTSFGAPATNNTGFNFSATPNLSFGSGSNDFQFSAKSNESGNATTAQTPQTTGFVFGAQTPAAPASVFSAPAFGTTSQTGSFTIGTAESGRKIKKAVRRKR